MGFGGDKDLLSLIDPLHYGALFARVWRIGVLGGFCGHDGGRLALVCRVSKLKCLEAEEWAFVDVGDVEGEVF